MGDPKLIDTLRASIRSCLTLALIAALVFLVVRGVDFGMHGTEDAAGRAPWKETITVFLAIYGPLLGFWLGQQAYPQLPGGSGSRRRR